MAVELELIEGGRVRVWSKYPRDVAACGPYGVCAGGYHDLSVMRDRFHWARLLAFVSGLVNQELLLRNEYLAAENRILRAQLPSRLRLSDAERSTLAEIAKRLGRKALKDIARVAKPDTILDWYRRLVAQKFDGSRRREYPGRPRVSPEIEALVVRFACENRSLGIRSHRRGTGQPGPSGLRPNRG